MVGFCLEDMLGLPFGNNQLYAVGLLVPEPLKFATEPEQISVSLVEAVASDSKVDGESLNVLAYTLSPEVLLLLFVALTQT